MSALETALNWTQLITSGCYDELASLGAPGATWMILGDPADTPFAGIKPYAGRVQHLRDHPKFKLEIKVIASAAEGDVAFLEYVSTRGGFNMEVIAKVIVKDGKITNVKEYLDSAPIIKLLAAVRR